MGVSDMVEYVYADGVRRLISSALAMLLALRTALGGKYSSSCLQLPAAE